MTAEQDDERPAAGAVPGRPSRKTILTVVVVTLAVAVAGTALAQQADPEETDGTTAFNTTTVSRRDLAEVKTIDGTVELGDSIQLSAPAGGTLTAAAAEGVVLERGDIVLVVSDEPTDIERATMNQQLAAARAQVAAADAGLATVTEGASAADLASAESQLLQAQLAAERLLDPASPADIDTARAQVAQAEESLADLTGGASSAEITAASAQVTQTQANTTSTENARTMAWTALLNAQRAYCALASPPVDACLPADIPLGAADAAALAEAVKTATAAGSPAASVVGVWQALLTADASYASAQAAHTSALAAVQSAADALDRLLAGPSPATVDAAEASVAQARENLERLLAGPDELEIGQAQANVAAAEARRDALVTGASSADRSQARASVESARASLSAATAQAASMLDGAIAAVVLYGGQPSWRALSTASAPGADIAQLETNLAALGFAGDLRPDETFDDVTAAAVSAWQESLGLDPTGEVALGEAVFVPGPVQVQALAPGVQVGGEVMRASPVLAVTTVAAVIDIVTDSGVTETVMPGQRVVASLPAEDRSLVAAGDDVTVELPDRSEVTAEVTSIGSVPIADPTGAASYVEVTLSLSEDVSDVWTGAAVDVSIVSKLAEGVLSVPVTALLALVEGGYAVETVTTTATGTGTTLLGVEVGMFADGFVEISGDGITEGLEVRIP